MIRPLLLIPAVFLSASLATSNPRSILQEDASDADRQTHMTDSHALAKKIYSRDCAMCHGNDGSGKTDMARNMRLIPPDWTDQKTLAYTPDNHLFSVIRNGKGSMPPEESGRAKDEDVKNLIAYIRSFSKGQAVVARSDPGK